MEFEQDSRSESPIENSEITVINSGESDVTLVSSNCLVVPDDREISSASLEESQNVDSASEKSEPEGALLLRVTLSSDEHKKFESEKGDKNPEHVNAALPAEGSEEAEKKETCSPETVNSDEAPSHIKLNISLDQSGFDASEENEVPEFKGKDSHDVEDVEALEEKTDFKQSDQVGADQLESSVNEGIELAPIEANPTLVQVDAALRAELEDELEVEGGCSPVEESSELLRSDLNQNLNEAEAEKTTEEIVEVAVSAAGEQDSEPLLIDFRDESDMSSKADQIGQTSGPSTTISDCLLPQTLKIDLLMIDGIPAEEKPERVEETNPSLIETKLIDPEDDVGLPATQTDPAELLPQIPNEETSRRVGVLIEKVEETCDLVCEYLDHDMDCAEKAFTEIMDLRKSIKQKILEDQDILKSLLQTLIPSTEPQSALLKHLEVCFEYGHWLDRTVKPKRLEEIKSSAKDYIVVNSPGITKVRSIIDQHANNVSYPPLVHLDTPEPTSKRDPFLVFVTHVNHPGEFYIVRMCDMDNRLAMFKLLNEIASTLPAPDDITPGQMYAVCNDGGRWFRGVCGKKCGMYCGPNESEPLYEFYMVDQGHFEQIRCSLVRCLTQELLNIPPFARECTLNHNFKPISWDANATASFKRMLRRSPMNMRVFKQENSILNVDLAQLPCFGDDSNIVSVRDALLFSHRPEVPQTSFSPPRAFAPKLGPSSFVGHTHNNLKYFSVYISLASTPMTIYVQLMDDELLKYELMFKELQLEMHSSETNQSLHVQRGGCYACKYKNEWYRVLLEDFKQGSCVEVFFVDTGHRATIRASECVALPDRFMSMPAQALRCVLDGVQQPPKKVSRFNRSNYRWPNEVVNAVHLANKKTGVIFFEKYQIGEVSKMKYNEQTAYVVLYLDGHPQSLNTTLCSSGLVFNSKKHMDTIEHSEIRNRLISERAHLDANGDSLDFQMPEMNVSIDSFPTTGTNVADTTSSSIPSTPVTTAPPAHYFPANDGDGINEHPEEVESTEMEKASCDMEQPTEVEKTTNRSAQFSQAIDVSPLLGFRPPLPTPRGFADSFCLGNPTEFKMSSREVSEELSNVSEDAEIFSAFRGVDGAAAAMPVDHVENDQMRAQRQQVDSATACFGMPDGARSDQDFVTDTGIFHGTRPIPNETAILGRFSWAQSPDAMYFRTKEMSTKWIKLRSDMKAYYTGSEPPKNLNFDVGYKCAVFTDNVWVRAEVTCIDNFPKCVVLLADTWYECDVDCKFIRPLAPEFDIYPRLMFKCSLFGIYPTSEKWDKKVNTHIYERLLAADHVYIFRRGRPKSQYDPIPSMIIYTLDVEGGPLELAGTANINLNEELITLGYATNRPFTNMLPVPVVPAFRSWKSIPLPKTVTNFWGIVTWVNKEAEIFLHDVRSSQLMQDIIKWLNEAYNSTEPTEADLNCRPGDLCIAKYPLDGNWHRAVVKEILLTKQVTVFFVDYGTLDNVGQRDIRLNIMLEDLETQAFRCVLHNIQPPAVDRLQGHNVFKEETLDYLHTLTVEKEFRVKVKGRGPPLSVSLIKNQVSIVKQLVQENLAEYVESPKPKKKSQKRKSKLKVKVESQS